MASAAVDHAWSSFVHTVAHGGIPPVAQLSALCSSSRVDVLVSLAYDQIEGRLQSEVIAPFWQRLQAAQSKDGSLQHGLLPALQELARAVDAQAQQLSALSQHLLLGLMQQQQQQPSTLLPHQSHQQQQQAIPASTVALLAGLCERHRMTVLSLLMATAPLSLPGVLQQYYHAKLHELCTAIQQLQDQDDSDAMSEDPTSPKTQQQQQPQHHQQQQQQPTRSPSGPDPLSLLGAAWADELCGVAACLQQLGLGAASEEAYTRVINSYVLSRLRGLSTKEFDVSVLLSAQPLVCAGPLGFLRLVLTSTGELAHKLQEWQLRLTYLMLETLGALRSADMFDIVIDFPDSAPALQDLAVCLQHTSLAGHFAATFRAALQQRLLHAGAATAGIIHTYVSTIRAMQQVDKSGVLLELVSEPIRAYLRSRPDTIRCIVSMLTDDSSSEPSAAAGGPGGSSLLEELQQQQHHQQQQPSAQQQQQLGPQGATGVYGFGMSTAAAAVGGAGVSGSSSIAAASEAAHASYNWYIGESDGDEAALRLLESLEAGPEGPTAAAAAGNDSSRPAATTGDGSAMLQGLGLPVRPPAAAASGLLCGLGGGGGRGDGDVVAMLIGIYGGPLLFMEEYRRMLADRLLCKEEYECVREIRTLELLKIRFGDAGLHACEVLLKDMADSKRLDSNIRALRHGSGPGAAAPTGQKSLAPEVDTVLSRCRATVCSYLFWPELPEHDLKLPPELQTALEVYAERFSYLKAPRKLQWRPSLGLVELSVTIGDSPPLDFKVTPVHAALLLQFADHNTSSNGGGSRGLGSSHAAAADEGATSPLQQQQQQSGVVWRSASVLSSALGVPVAVVRRKAMFWVAAGVLLERRGGKGEVVYARATRIDPSRIGSYEATDYSWVEAAGASSSAEDRLVAEMGPFENYIIGMLTNFGALPADRLHNMLRVFVVGEPKYAGRSQEQLAAFLQLLVEQGTLQVANGIYSKSKDDAAAMAQGERE